MVSRREFLKRSGAGLGGVAAARYLAIGAGGVLGALVSSKPAGAAAFEVPMPLPTVLTDPDITLVAREAAVPILPGAPTTMWTFNDSFPGPLIRRPSGEPTRVTVQHQLPEAVGSLTVHHHGNHSASSEDGQPERNVIEPGASRTYTYEFVDDGEPERAAFQWYHDHSHLRTGRNVWHGLAGMVILDDEFDASLPLPKGEFDVAMLITDREFDSGNQLVDRFTAPDRESDTAVDALTGGGYPPTGEVAGNVILINGAPQPYFEVAPRKYRLRFLNASGFRPFNLTFADGREMAHIATESGLMPAPISRTEILLGPGERAEVVVDFTDLQGGTVVLESQPTDYQGRFATGAPTAGLMQFRVTAPLLEPDTSSVPDELRPLPEWTNGISDEVDRIWAFGLGVDTAGRPAWTINGQAFDHTRIDAQPALGSTETWMLVNTTPSTSHYIHIHDVDWKMISRNNEAPPDGEDCLKETFRLDPGDFIVVAAKFTDHLGPYMLHCHMLDHEDHGMMTSFEVVAPAASDRKSGDLDTVIDRTVASATERAKVRGAIHGRPGALRGPAATVTPRYFCKPF